MLELVNNFETLITLVPAANIPNAYHAHFDVNVALSWYIMDTLLVDFRCPDLKDSRTVGVHIQNIDVNFQDGKMQFYVLSTLFINA